MKRFLIPALAAALTSGLIAAPQAGSPKSTGTKAPAVTTLPDAKSAPAKTAAKAGAKAKKDAKHKDATK